VGSHLANPRVTTRRVRRVTVDAPAPLPTQLDGEIDGTTPLTITVAPRALRLRLPRG